MMDSCENVMGNFSRLIIHLKRFQIYHKRARLVTCRKYFSVEISVQTIFRSIDNLSKDNIQSSLIDFNFQELL